NLNGQLSTTSSSYSSPEPSTDLFPGSNWMVGRICVNRHSDGINVAFADGSARTVPLPAVASLTWFRGYVPLPGAMPLPNGN
ncbi:MAG TPA: H-X9-DG-CTERM domain-containing protein, partial [Tepidisphaeraceae bacterium]|nr:H-X9-DG-CTERM domain-containing protein [Tepidisphaeraceae bacterium]